MTFVAEPTISIAPNDRKHLRWRWWYSGIADYRLANPGCSNVEVAKHLNKHENTIGFIVNSDIYKEYEAQRKREVRQQNDELLRDKLHGVALKTLNALDAKLTKQLDQIPMPLAVDLMKSSLDRLGFAPQTGPSVQVIANQQNNNVMLPTSVTPSVLEEARMALRTVEKQRLRPSAPLRLEAEPLELSGEAQPGELSESESEVFGGTSTTDS